MAKEKPEIEENEKQMAVRKEIRKEWSSIEPKLIEMVHKLEETGTLNHFIIHSKLITHGSPNWKHFRMPGNSWNMPSMITIVLGRIDRLIIFHLMNLEKDGMRMKT